MAKNVEEVANGAWLLDAARVALRDGRYADSLRLVGDAARVLGLLAVTELNAAELRRRDGSA